MMQYLYSYYTNSTKKNVISVWNFSKEVKLVPLLQQLRIFYLIFLMIGGGMHLFIYLLTCLEI